VPKVFIPTSLRTITGGLAELEIEGATVRQIISSIEARYPGFESHLLDEGRLKPNLAVAIDDTITPLGLLQSVSPKSEVHFITAIRGGLTFLSRNADKPDAL
jgi:molybdopterin synthase sulfur carrier subunit